GPKKGRSPPEAMDLRETRSNSQISHSIPTSIPSEFPRIDISGRALGQDEMDAAIQTTSTSKVRRVDFGGCGPPQQLKVHSIDQSPGSPLRCYLRIDSRDVLESRAAFEVLWPLTQVTVRG